MDRPLPNPFEEVDAARNLTEVIITRDEIENMKTQMEWLQEQVRTMMAVVTMLAEAENYRIKKAADKIKS